MTAHHLAVIASVSEAILATAAALRSIIDGLLRPPGSDWARNRGASQSRAPLSTSQNFSEHSAGRRRFDRLVHRNGEGLLHHMVRESDRILI